MKFSSFYLAQYRQCYHKIDKTQEVLNTEHIIQIYTCVVCPNFVRVLCLHNIKTSGIINYNPIK